MNKIYKIMASMMILCIVLTGCSKTKVAQNPKSEVQGTLLTSDTAIISSTIWSDLSEGKSNISAMYGLPGILVTANDGNETLKQIGEFLKNSIPYTKLVPKSGSKPYAQYAGYLGPPVFTISNKNHKIIINPAWYVETPGNGQFKVQHISGVLEVNIDGQIKYIYSQTFYDWMYNTEEWLPSFHN